MAYSPEWYNFNYIWEKYGINLRHLKDWTPLTFITGLKYNANVIKALNGLTFLYDPNWEYGSESPTYPISFYMLKKCTEDMSSEVSQKPLLFYNSEVQPSANSVKGGLMNVVADNIIIKPKTYKLEVIVPANIEGLWQNNYFSLEQNTEVMNFVMGDTDSISSQLISIPGKFSSLTMSTLTTLFTSLYGTEVSPTSIMQALTHTKTYNKDSLEYMWKNRRIIKMKEWNSWKFKYLVIQNVDISKEGTNGDFFEGTITLQEVPIVTLRPASSGSVTKMSAISQILGKGIKVATDSFIKAMQTTSSNEKKTTSNNMLAMGNLRR